MPAITIVDLNNAKADVDHITQVASSNAATVTDRFGNTKKTISKVLSDAETRANTEVASVRTAATQAIDNVETAAAQEVADLGSSASAAMNEIVSNIGNHHADTYDETPPPGGVRLVDIVSPAPGAGGIVESGPNAGWYRKTGAAGLPGWERLENQPAPLSLAQATAQELSDTSGKLAALTERSVDAYRVAQDDLLFSVSDEVGNASWVEATRSTGGPTEHAVRHIREALSYQLRNAPGVLFTVADPNGVLTDMTIESHTGQVPDWVIQRWAPRIAALLDPAQKASREFYVRGPEVLPVHADTTKVAGWGSSSMGTFNWRISPIVTGEWNATYYDGGFPSQTIDHIAARMGSIPALVTVAGGTIPASGVVTVTTNMARVINFVCEGTLAGVPGTLAWNEAAYSYEFTRAGSGAATEVAPDTPFVSSHGLEQRDSVALLWMGKNDLARNSPVENRAKVIEYTDRSFDWLAPLYKRAIVMGHFINRDEPVDSLQRAHINTVNAAHQARYGELFLDVQAYLMSQQVWADTGVTPTADDLSNQEIGNIPPSLSSDHQHLTAVALQAVANLLKARVESLGWY